MNRGNFYCTKTCDKSKERQPKWLWLLPTKMIEISLLSYYESWPILNKGPSGIGFPCHCDTYIYTFFFFPNKNKNLEFERKRVKSRPSLMVRID